jgi:pimeloyl-ACP methyl ester carboxylesterase
MSMHPVSFRLSAIRCLLYMAFMTLAHTASGADGVILLHGLARSAGSMAELESRLADAGYVVVNVDYPSRTAGIKQLSEEVISAALADPRLKSCDKIHFVTHSLGGILLRVHAAKNRIPKLSRVVMLGPPNQGSEVVDRIGPWKLFKRINGPAGGELGTGPDSLPNLLGPVNFELGVIAGDRSINWINSAMIKGPDDGKVSVERTKVAGMKAHVVFHVTHPMMMRNRAVIDATLRFMATGAFRE